MSRQSRQAEIDAMIAEMMSSEPTVKTHPKIKGEEAFAAPLHTTDGAVIVGTGHIDAAIGEDNDSVEDNDVLSESDEEADSIPPPPRADQSQQQDGHETAFYAPENIESAQQKSPEDIIDEFALERKVPISHQVDLGGHGRAVTCISLEPAGNRVVSGSLDYFLKFYDFGGMDSRHNAFRSVEPDDGHPVISISHSSSGDRFIVGTGSCQPRVFDRDGAEVIKFVRGDMYLRDLSNTKGHTMEVTCVCWHPIERNIIMTASLDGSLRLWDLQGEAAFGNLINKHVLKIRGATGQSRVGATSCCYTNDGNRMIAGAADGSIQMWMSRKVYSRPDVIIRPAHGDNVAVTCVAMSPTESHVLGSRGADGTIMLWDLRKPKTPYRKFIDIPNVYPTANLSFSPDGSLLVCGTSVSKRSSEEKSYLAFFETRLDAVVASEACLTVGMKAGSSVISVKWQPKTNQIFCSMSSGLTTVLYDPRMSVKGAVITAGRAPKRVKDPTDFAVTPEIYNPHALKMYKKNPVDDKRQKAELKKDPIRSKIPEKPIKGTNANNHSFFFTKYVMDGRGKSNSGIDTKEDPREALLKMDQKAKDEPIFFGSAYAANQPKVKLHDRTFEEETEEFNNKKRRL